MSQTHLILKWEGGAAVAYRRHSPNAGMALLWKRRNPLTLGSSPRRCRCSSSCGCPHVGENHLLHSARDVWQTLPNELLRSMGGGGRSLCSPPSERSAMITHERTSPGANCLALLRKRIGVHVHADDGGVRVVVAENLAKTGSIGGHRFRSRLA